MDPGQLISYGVTLDQVIDSLAKNNTDVGGNYLTQGEQNFNIRGMGLIKNLDDITNAVVAEKAGTSVFVRNLGETSMGYRVRLGKVGIDDRDDVVEGVVLLQRGAKALPVLDQINRKMDELNSRKLPHGVAIKTFYDRTALIHTTIETVVDILIAGILLVSIILYVFLGHVRTAMIVALTVPLALLFTFCLLVLLGDSANLISLGAIDFGIIVDSTLIMVESIFSHLAHKRSPDHYRADAYHEGGPRSGPSHLLCHDHHHRRLRAVVYDDRRSGQDLCPHVAHLWAGLDRGITHGLHAGPSPLLVFPDRSHSSTGHEDCGNHQATVPCGDRVGA